MSTPKVTRNAASKAASTGSQTADKRTRTAPALQRGLRMPYLERRINDTTTIATPPSAKSDKEVGSGTCAVASPAKRASRTTDKGNNAKPVKKSILRLIFIIVIVASSELLFGASQRIHNTGHLLVLTGYVKSAGTECTELQRNSRLKS